MTGSQEYSHKRSGTKKWMIVVALVIFACMVTALFFISPEEIVDTLGVENTYLIVFLLAAVGGISTVTGASVFLTLATFASGGANAWLLGLVAGLGIFISDSVFYILAKKGSDFFEGKMGRLRHRLESFVQRASPWNIRLGVFAYVGITPLPNDILMLALALARVPYALIAPPIFIGSVSIATIVAHFGEFLLSFA
jgi:hypothetical protein